MDWSVEELARVHPSKRQLSFQETEFYAFAHFGMSTFTGREWGLGSESPSLFNPRALNTDQWCAAFRDAGMKAAIITAKHHDGFCLFDSAYTEHTVMHSPFGRDVVSLFAASCKKYGLKMGVYLSPWDRHDQRYGTGKDYDDYFCNQLTELLTRYGDVFDVWFDGACGEGPNGKRQVYDFNRYFGVVRNLMPKAVISVCGPDVRWCGNEAGHCRTSEWSVVPAGMAENERTQERSQQEDNEAFRQRVPSDEEDIGSRAALRRAERLIWYPAEVNTSIRPGWFYHHEEDDKVRALSGLQDIYVKSVGGNATFLLNVPPDTDGRLAEPDVKRLEEMGAWLRRTFSHNLLSEAQYSVTSGELTNEGIWKAADNDEAAALLVRTAMPVSPRYAVLQEDIEQGQRIERFALDARIDGEWREIARGTVVGYKRIVPMPEVLSSDSWRVRIPESRMGVRLKTFALY